MRWRGLAGKGDATSKIVERWANGDREARRRLCHGTRRPQARRDPCLQQPRRRCNVWRNPHHPGGPGQCDRSGRVGVRHQPGARPGGNMSGHHQYRAGFRRQALVAAQAGSRRASPWQSPRSIPNTAPSRGLYHLGSFEEAARAAGIEPVRAEVRSDDEIEQAVASMERRQGGFVAIPDAFMNIHRGTVIAQAIRHNVPAIYDSPSFAREGGLIQYGPDFRETYRRAAFYADRVLRGASLGDLPDRAYRPITAPPSST